MKKAVRRVPLCMVVRHLHRMRGVLAPRIYRQFCFPYFYYTIISTKRQGFLPGFLWFFSFSGSFAPPGTARGTHRHTRRPRRAPPAGALHGHALPKQRRHQPAYAKQAPSDHLRGGQRALVGRMRHHKRQNQRNPANQLAETYIHALFLLKMSCRRQFPRSAEASMVIIAEQVFDEKSFFEFLFVEILFGSGCIK